MVEVLDKNNNVICVFNKSDTEDQIINPTVNYQQNGESTFTFQLSLKNKKWPIIKNPENSYRVNNRIYTPLIEGAYERVKTEGNENLIIVKTFEIWNLLSTEYVRAWNSTTGFANIDDYMVVIVSGGNLPLKNNGDLVNPKFPLGSAGYMLEGLLYGTGWTVDIVDVEGKFDLETDQLTILENIFQVQSLYGGIFVWDSLNKKVSLRSDEKFLPYSGFEIRTGKNLQSLEEITSNRIITRVIPLGEGGLNIRSVNNGRDYLENFEYSTLVRKQIINNPDIYEPDKLMTWGLRRLKELSKPEISLDVKVADLRKIEGFELETFEVNDIVDVVDIDVLGGEITKLRIIGWQYDIFDITKSNISLSNLTQEVTNSFQRITITSNKVDNGRIESTRIVDFSTGGTIVNFSGNFNDLYNKPVLKEGNNIKLDIVKEINETTINATSKYKLLFDGPSNSPTEINTDVNINLNLIEGENISDYDAIIITIGRSNQEVESVFIGKDNPYSNWNLTMLSNSYARGFMSHLNNIVTFNVREIVGILVTEINIKKIVGIKF